MDDPINLVDPEGLKSKKYGGADSEDGKSYPIGGLEYDNKTDSMDVYDDSGELRKRIPASSGRNGVKDPSVPNQGPIPPGKYTIPPGEVRETNWRLRLKNEDWGDMRAPLKPSKENEMHGRSGFWLHGGEEPGTAGCIDLGPNDTEILDNIRKKNKDVPVRVK